jgi:hypothetical protein
MGAMDYATRCRMLSARPGEAECALEFNNGCLTHYTPGFLQTTYKLTGPDEDWKKYYVGRAIDWVPWFLSKSPEFQDKLISHLQTLLNEAKARLSGIE